MHRPRPARRLRAFAAALPLAAVAMAALTAGAIAAPSATPPPAPALAKPMVCPLEATTNPLDEVLWPGCATFGPFGDVGQCPPIGACPRPCAQEALDPSGAVVRTRRYEWTFDGKLAAEHTTNASGSTGTVRYRWENGRPVGMEDGGGRTSFLWNDRGYVYRAVYEAPGLVRSTSWTRDDAGRITQVSASEDSHGLFYEYGPDGRLLTEISGTGATTYTYDEAGRLVRATDGTLTTEWAWGPRGQVERRVQRYAGEPPAVTTYTYDDKGRPVETRTENTSGVWRVRWKTRCE